MTPKDWMKIKSLLAETADKETLDKIHEAMTQGVTAQCVKSVQFVTITVGVSSSSTSLKKEQIVTISEVNPDKTILIADKTVYDTYSYAVLNSATQVRGYYGTSAYGSCTLRVYVVEFY